MIRKGLKFKSLSFSALAEIVEVRIDKNEVDVLFTPSNGNSWVEKNMELNALKENFRTEVYKEFKIPDADRNISIF